MRTQAVEARQYLKGYTAIEGPLTGEVPLAAYTMYNEFTPADVALMESKLPDAVDAPTACSTCACAVRWCASRRAWATLRERQNQWQLCCMSRSSAVIV